MNKAIATLSGFLSLPAHGLFILIVIGAGWAFVRTYKISIEWLLKYPASSLDHYFYAGLFGFVAFAICVGIVISFIVK